MMKRPIMESESKIPPQTIGRDSLKKYCQINYEQSTSERFDIL